MPTGQKPHVVETGFEMESKDRKCRKKPFLEALKLWKIPEQQQTLLFVRLPHDIVT